MCFEYSHHETHSHGTYRSNTKFNCGLNLNPIYAVVDATVIYCGHRFGEFTANQTWHGAAFGILATVGNFFAQLLLNSCGIKNRTVNIVLGHALGGAMAFGALAMLTSQGVLAAPISISAALIMVTCNLATNLLLAAANK